MSVDYDKQHILNSTYIFHACSTEGIRQYKDDIADDDDDGGGVAKGAKKRDEGSK